MDPFLPWPGSKKKCAGEIISEFPLKFRTYYEPFLGSGAIFFALERRSNPFAFEGAELSDINAKLINCWKAVAENPERVGKMVEHCLSRNSEEFYGIMRGQMDSPAVFIYVMRAAFSSMYRENVKGQFNVPWRKQDFENKKGPLNYDVSKLIKCSEFIQQKKALLSVADWMVMCQLPGAGDVVYLDPPYVPYDKGGFTSYDKSGFTEGNHVFLRTNARLMAERGAFVAMSNSYTPNSVRIYGEPARLLNVTNSVKSTATTKGTRQEGLWIWSPK